MFASCWFGKSRLKILSDFFLFSWYNNFVTSLSLEAKQIREKISVCELNVCGNRFWGNVKGVTALWLSWAIKEE